MTGSDTLFQPGKNCWRVEDAGRFAMIVDGADYFVAVREAMTRAQHSIYLIGWDFDARIKLGSETAEGPETLGDFILWLANRTPSLEIRLLRWDTGAFKAVFRGNTLVKILQWKWHKRITLQLDSAHPFAGSHHQKIVVIDDRMAFCGGIDMTIGRLDSRAHKDDDPIRTAPNGTIMKPWHDATSAFDGPAARAMGDLARERWAAATGETLPPVEATGSCWPDGLEPELNDIRIAIARTWPETAEHEPVHEIESMYIDLINSAKDIIYAESQYFASRRVAQAIACRLVEEDGPEIVIINPVSAEGWLEPIAMDSARARLMEALERVDRHDRLRLYHPVTAKGEEIYVHAKVMVVDDSYIRVGSSNFNNRSLRFDTECDVVLSKDATSGEDVAERIALRRNDLIAEHLDTTPEAVAEELSQRGSLIAAIDALRARSEGRTLIDFKMPELSTIEAVIADNEILDPVEPDAIFEPLENRGLFKGWSDRLRGHMRRIAGRGREGRPSESR